MELLATFTTSARFDIVVLDACADRRFDVLRNQLDLKKDSTVAQEKECEVDIHRPSDIQSFERKTVQLVYE